MTLTAAVAREATSYLESWLAYRQRYLRLPGVQAAVLLDDEIIMSVAFGRADVEQDVSLTPEHVFRVASHSKTFTATAMLQLASTGPLRLDDQIGRWLTWLPEAGSPVARLTVRELLQHSSGLTRDGTDADWWQLSRPFPDEATLRRVVLGGAQILEPNERFKYSNIGYALLGLVIEAVSGRSYAALVGTEIIDRLDLRHTSPDLDDSRSECQVVGYSAFAYADERVPIARQKTGAMAAATGFASTAEDLCRYAAAHFPGDSRLLDDSAKRLMQHRHWDVEGQSDGGYGLGWSIVEVGGRPMVGHGGAFPGQLSRTVFDPDARLAVAVCTNAIDGAASELALSMVRLLDLAAVSGDGVSGDAASGDAARFAGRYANLWGVRDIVPLGGRLLLLDPTVDDPTQAGTYSELSIESETALRVSRGPGYGGVGERMLVSFLPDGAVSSITDAGGLTTWPLERYRPPTAHD